MICGAIWDAYHHAARGGRRGANPILIVPKKEEKKKKKRIFPKTSAVVATAKVTAFHAPLSRPSLSLSLSLSAACLPACERACGVFALAKAGKSSQLTHLAGCSSLCRCARTALILLTLLSISSFFSSNLCLGSFVCLRALQLACLHGQEALRPHAR